MGATLIESPDEHHWVLLDHQVTQIIVDAGSFRVQTWSLDGSAEIRCSAPFRLRQSSGAGRTIHPAETETLAPVLALLRVSLVIGAGRQAAGWEVQGGGALEGMSYSGALPQLHGD
jgi:hypothetical protein